MSRSMGWSIWFLMRYLLSAADGYLLSVSSLQEISCLTSLFLIALIHHKGSTLMIYLSPKGSTAPAIMSLGLSLQHRTWRNVSVHRIYHTEAISLQFPLRLVLLRAEPYILIIQVYAQSDILLETMQHEKHSVHLPQIPVNSTPF